MLQKTVCKLIAILLTSISIAHSGIAFEEKQPVKELVGGETKEYSIDETTTIVFCWIPPGTEQLGSTKEERQAICKSIGLDAETKELTSTSQEIRKKHTSTGFWLAKYTITQTQWNALGVAKKLECRFSSTGRGASLVKGIDTTQFPVESVSWGECQSFVDNLNLLKDTNVTFGSDVKFSIPTEDQWEFAARGGSKQHQVYHWGNEMNGIQGNCNGDDPFGTEKIGPFLQTLTPVGTYEKQAHHPWGLCDMSGNVWQWCVNSSATEKAKCITRGGCWYSSAGFCTLSSRRQYNPDSPDSEVGFRIVAIPIKK